MSKKDEAWPTLTADEREALERFHETWEDDQGYDVPKPMMKRLAKLGVVYSEGFGRYGMTTFGLAVLQSTLPAAPVQEPVQNLYGWKFYQGCYVMHPEVLQAVIDEAIKQARSAPTVQEPVAYTTGHCIEKAKPGGCPLQNLHCKFPACDRKES
jgi:hypothetical protein